MNWNSPVADEVLALAFGLRFDSRSAVLSRYSKPAPVTRAASRIAPVTRVAISAVAPLMRVAISIAASVPMARSGWPGLLPRRLAPSAVMVNDKLIRNRAGAPWFRAGGLDGADDSHAKPARRALFRGFRRRKALRAHA